MQNHDMEALKIAIGYDFLYQLHRRLPENGVLRLRDAIALLSQEETAGERTETHFKNVRTEALAEIVLHFIDAEFDQIDKIPTGEQFSALTSFVAEKKDLVEIRATLRKILDRAGEENNRHDERYEVAPGSLYLDWWTKEEINHISELVQRLDSLLLLPGERLDLVDLENQTLQQFAGSRQKHFTILPEKEAEYLQLRGIDLKAPCASPILLCAERWGWAMEQEIANGRTVADAAEITLFDADSDRMSGAMFGFVMKTLCTFWIYGEQFRQWQMRSCDSNELEEQEPASDADEMPSMEMR